MLLDEPAVLVSKLNPRKPRVTVVEPQAGERHCASTEFMCFVPRNPDEVLNYWAYYLASSDFSTRLQRVAVGSTNSHTRASPSEVIRWSVPNPPSPQKHAIAQILNALDSTIRQTEAIIEKLKQVKQGLLHDLLVPRRNEVWRRTRLGDVCEHITKGATPTTFGFEWQTEGVLFLRSECVTEAGVSEAGAQFIGHDAHAAMRRSTVRGGDILMTITGYIGRSARYPAEWPEANINQHIARIRVADSPTLIDRFVAWALKHPAVRESLAVEVTGVAYPQIGLAQVRNIVIPVPEINLQRSISAALDAAHAEIDLHEVQALKLRLLKSGLMDDLLTGRVRVTPLLA